MFAKRLSQSALVLLPVLAMLASVAGVASATTLATVTGTITASSVGLQNVDITVNHAGQSDHVAHAVTDSGGHYSVQVASSDTYDFVVTPPGTSGYRATTQTLTITADQVFDVALVPSGSITVNARLVGPSDANLSGITFTYQQLGRGTTGSDGQVSFQATAGSSQLSVQGSGTPYPGDAFDMFEYSQQPVGTSSTLTVDPGMAASTVHVVDQSGTATTGWRVAASQSGSRTVQDIPGVPFSRV